MESTKRFEPEPTSAQGDFYVENGCCITCGVPQVIVPNLVGWTDEESGHCRWIAQPSNPQELEQAFAILNGQELGCHRYAGHDPEIQDRVGYENCDYPPPRPEALQAAIDSVLNFATLSDEGLLNRLWRRIVRKSQVQFMRSTKLISAS